MTADSFADERAVSEPELLGSAAPVAVVSNRSRFRLAGLILFATAVTIAVSQWKAIQVYGLRWKAENQSSRMEIPAALETALLAQQYSPKDPRTLLLLCRLQRQSGQIRESRETIDELQNAGVPESRIQNERRLTAARSGDLESSEPFLPQLLTSDELEPQDVCEAFVVGYLSRFRMDEAVRLTEVWKQDFPDDFRPYAHRAIIAQMATDWTLAVDEFQKAVDRGDSRSETLIRFGLCCIEINEPQRALPSFTKCTNLFPEETEGWLGLADTQNRLGNTADARISYERCLELDPLCWDAELRLARLLLGNGNAVEAEARLRRLAEIWPEDAGTLFQFGQALQALGRTEEAAQAAVRWEAADRQTELMEQLLTDLQQQPQNVALRSQIGVMMMKHYSRSMAVQFLEAVLLEEPDNESAHEALADYFDKHGQADVAEQHRRHLNH